MITPSLQAGLAQLQALAGFIDLGSSNATFIFYDDTKPASVSVTANNMAKIATLTLPNPCFKKVNASNIELYPTDTAIAIKTSTATWARLFNGNGDAVADFTIGTADADIILNNVNIVLGASINLGSIVLEPST